MSDELLLFQWERRLMASYKIDALEVVLTVQLALMTMVINYDNS